MSARYAVHTAKALEAILWLASARPGLDVFHIVTAAYLADKAHVAAYGRPLFGEEYVAGRYGPVGSTVYGLLTGGPFDRLAIGGNGRLPFRVSENFCVQAEREANARVLSPSDVAALGKALAMVADLSFDELVEAMRDDPAYVAANGGRMQYENMLDRGDAGYRARADDLQAAARHAAF